MTDLDIDPPTDTDADLHRGSSQSIVTIDEGDWRLALCVDQGAGIDDSGLARALRVNSDWLARIAVVESTSPLPPADAVREQLEPPLRADGGEIVVCPACDSSQVRTNATRHVPHRYRCEACGHTFDDPVRRPPKKGGGNRSGLSKRLADMDPDDLRADGGLIPVCPHCDSARVHVNSTRGRGDRWRCYGCGETFDDAERRPPAAGTQTRVGLAKRLVEMDPDDLATDGGLPRHPDHGWLDQLAPDDPIRVRYLNSSDRAERTTLEGTVAEVRSAEDSRRATASVLLDAPDGTRYRVMYTGEVSRLDSDRELTIGYMARVDVPDDDGRETESAMRADGGGRCVEPGCPRYGIDSDRCGWHDEEGPI